MREANLTTANPVDFERARELAHDSVSETCITDPMLVAYYDFRAGRAGPEPACHGESPDAARIFAEGHEATWRVDVNGGEYVFYFRTTPVGTVEPDPVGRDTLHGSEADGS